MNNLAGFSKSSFFGSNNIMGGSKNFTIDWVTINPSIVSFIWSRHTSTDPLSQQCRKFIMQKLGTDIRFRRGNVEWVPKGQFKKIVEDKWARFVRNCYDCLQVLGIIPVEFLRYGDENSDLYPNILPPNTYVIQLSYIAELGRTIYRVLRPKIFFFNQYANITDKLPPIRKGMEIIIKSRKYREKYGNNTDWNTMFNDGSVGSQLIFHREYNNPEGLNNQPNILSHINNNVPDGYILDRNVIVLSGFGSDPKVDGTLTTSLYSLRGEQEFLKIHAQLMMTNQIRMISRPLFFQKEVQESSNVEIMSEGFRTARFSENDLTKPEKSSHKEDGDETRFVRDKESMENLAKVIALYHGIPGDVSGIDHLRSMSVIDANKTVIDQAMDMVRNAYQPIAEVPAGFSLPSNQKMDPTVGQRYFEIKAELDEITSTAYGIPLSLLRNNGALRSNVEEKEKFVQDTVVDKSRQISEVMTIVYEMIYEDIDRLTYAKTAARLLERPNDVYSSEIINAISVAEWMGNKGEVTKRRIEKEGPTKYYTESDSDDEKIYGSDKEVDSDGNIDSDSDYEDKDERKDKYMNENKKLPDKIDKKSEMVHIKANKISLIQEIDHTSKNNNSKEEKNNKGKEKKSQDNQDSNLDGQRFRKVGTYQDSRETDIYKQGGGKNDKKTIKSSGNKDDPNKINMELMKYRERPISLMPREDLLKKMSNKIIEDYEPMTVILGGENKVMSTLLKDAFESGSITDQEYWSTQRSQLGYDMNENIYKKLTDQEQWRFNRENPPPMMVNKNTEKNNLSNNKSAKSKKPGMFSNKNKDPSKKIGKSQNEASSSEKRKRQKSRLGKNREMKNGKVQFKQTSSTNMKQSLSARRSQKSNAMKGRKAGQLSTKKRFSSSPMGNSTNKKQRK